MSESRQIRRARQRAAEKGETRRERFDRVHGQVLASKTVQAMWLLYVKNRYAGTGVDVTDEAVKAIVEHAFYAGAGSMFELMLRVSPDTVSEDVGVEMLNRLQEELDNYANKRGTS